MATTHKHFSAVSIRKGEDNGGAIGGIFRDTFVVAEQGVTGQVVHGQARVLCAIECHHHEVCKALQFCIGNC